VTAGRQIGGNQRKFTREKKKKKKKKKRDI
jgi:hypothetical protein